MSRLKILIIDDDSDVRERLAEVVSERYQAILARNSEEGLLFARQKKPHVIILNVAMPKMNGLEICQTLRSSADTKNIRVIMLNSVNNAEQKIKSFSAGADDFILKSIQADELLARLESSLRRVQEVQASPSIPFSLSDSYFIDYEQHKLTLNGASISLRAIEFRIMIALLNKKDQILRRQDLQDCVWDRNTHSDRSLDPHISAIRKKLKNSKFQVKSIYAVGYSLHLKND